MLKRITILAPVLAVVFLIHCVGAYAAIAAPVASAFPTASTVLVNGEGHEFDAYKINDNNYFKLRDLAYVLSGTKREFDVSWDSQNNAILLTSGKPYTRVGGELVGKGAGEKTPSPTSSRILLDGADVNFMAYNIENNNYFRLRDIGEAFDFGVDWDGVSNSIFIDTNKGYEAANGNPPERPATSSSGAVTIKYTDISVEYTFAALGEPEKYTGAKVTVEVVSPMEAVFTVSSIHPFLENKFTFDFFFGNYLSSIHEDFNILVAYSQESGFSTMAWHSLEEGGVVGSEPPNTTISNAEGIFSGLSIDKAKGSASWRLRLPYGFTEFNFDMVGVKPHSDNVKFDLDEVAVKITGYDEEA